MPEENPQIKAAAPVKKTYIKPAVTRLEAVSVVSGSGESNHCDAYCGCYYY